MNDLQKTETTKAVKALIFHEGRIMDAKQTVASAVKGAVVDAIETGKILNHMKEVMGTDFGEWVKENTTYDRAFAWNRMTLARNEKGVLEEANNPSEALKLLDPPKPETEAKKDVEQKKADKKTIGKSETASKETAKPAEEPKKSEPAKKPVGLKTPAGQLVPEHLIHIFERVNEIKLHVQQITNMMKKIHAGVKAGDTLYQFLNMNMLDIAAKNAKSALKFTIPYGICPVCGADDSQDCVPCKGSGFLNKDKFDAVTEDLK